MFCCCEAGGGGEERGEKGEDRYKNILLCQVIVSFNKNVLTFFWKGFGAEVWIMIFDLSDPNKGGEKRNMKERKQLASWENKHSLTQCPKEGLFRHVETSHIPHRKQD